MIQAILFNSSQKLASVLSFYLQRTQTSERFSSHELPKSDLITSEYVTPQTATGMKKCQRSKIAIYKVLFKPANHLPSGVVGVTYSLLYQIFPHFLSSVLSPHWKRLRKEGGWGEVEWMRSSKVVVVVDVDVSSGKILISGSGWCMTLGQKEPDISHF